MEEPYKFNFNDLSRFAEDFSYVMDKDGVGQRISEIFSTAENQAIIQIIIKWVVIFIQFCLIVAAIYILYIIIFKGYSRTLVDLSTFSFYNKEKPDNFIRERNLLTDQFKFLSKNHGGCITPFSIYESIYGSTNLNMLANTFEQNKDKYYNKYRYDDRYFNALKEYYLFYDKINNQNPQIVRFKDNQITINKYDAYELLLTYKTLNGEILFRNTEGGGNKGNDQQMYELYKAEEKQQFFTIRAIEDIHSILNGMANEVANMNNNFINKPIIPYLIIPVDDKSIEIILKDFSIVKKNILNNTIYTIPYSQLSDYSWYMIEYILSLSNQNQYNTFANNMPQYRNEDLSKIIYFINLSRDQKLIAEKKIMNYSQNPLFFDYIKQRPIFTHIYFSRTIPDKSNLYKSVMNTYRILGDCNSQSDGRNIDNVIMKKRLVNLRANGYLFKQLVNTVSFLNLFLNTYRQDLTITYEKQIISNNRFLKELWLPFFNDIFKNRIGTFTKTTFSRREFGKSYGKFLSWYKQLGKELNKMIKAVFMAFFTGNEVEPTKETSVDDNTYTE
jgi:hypothetical protein